MHADVVSFGETMLRLTAPPGMRLESASSLDIYVGGTESNMLACLARLGLQVQWISALPSNPIGRRVESELRRHAIDTSRVVWTSSTDRLGIFYAEELAPPLGVQVYYDRANAACAQINPQAIDYSAVDHARLLHLTGITPALGAGARAAFERFLERARMHNIALSFDVNYRGRLWSTQEAAQAIDTACYQATILISSYDDAVDLWHCHGSAEDVLRQLAGRFAADNPSKILVLTLGKDGSAQLAHDMYAHEPTFPTQEISRFGSGDAFAAGYLYAYLNGSLYQEFAGQGVTPLAFGNMLAAMKRGIHGDIATVSPDDVRAVLQTKRARFR
jgi:2-dehydro-3-deoxygluconokinase